jgi:hypothetical protein
MKMLRLIYTAIASATLICSLTVSATPPEPSNARTPTPHAVCQFRVLIVYSNSSGQQPTAIRNEILADPDVAGVDFFDASTAAPALAQLEQYGIVMTVSSGPFFNSTALGDNLAGYVDVGGVVVQSAFSFSGGLAGRWASGNYCPYNYSTGAELSESPAYFDEPAHPLLAGVTTLNLRFYEVTTIAPGATRVVSTQTGDALVAYRPVSGGHVTVGITAVLGNENHSGDWGKLIVNAGRWLLPCGAPTPTPTPTATATTTATPTVSATATVTATATATATATPIPTATATPAATATTTPIATATTTPAATPIATPTTNSHLANISTRMRVEGGDNVLIAGFIVEGSGNKRMILRGIGPSLAAFGIADPLLDPTLELNGSDGSLVAANDNWPGNSNAAEILASGLAPANPNESAILLSVAPGSYTAVLRGNSGSTGTGLVEVYDLDADGAAKVVNISTRGHVLTGENVMIGGLIVAGDDTSPVVLRGIGPSLSNFGVPEVLANPFLELHDGNGGLIHANNDWHDTQEETLQNSGLAPTDDLESAILISVAPGNYTAILKGADGGTGNGLLEVYQLNP